MRLYHDQPSGTVARARQLRRDAAAPERRLLRALREAFPDLKWRHQTPLGPFTANMLCFSEQLATEVNGDTHAASAADHAFPAAYMQRHGCRTLRLTNADAMHNLEGGIEQVSLGARTAQPLGTDEGEQTKKKGGAE